MFLRAVSALLALSSALAIDLELVHEWETFDWKWDSAHTKQDYLETGRYIPMNCALAGVKVAANGETFVTIPRWRVGVPASLNKLVQHGKDVVLEAWPSWSAQDMNDPSAMQSVQSMLIDSQNRMWVLDTGRRNFLDDPNLIVNGPAKLWIIDVSSRQVLHRYVFPDAVAPHDSSFINDIVLDETRMIAYISEAGTGAIIVYDYRANTSRRFSDASTKSESSVPFVTNGVDYGTNIFTTPTDGIAMSEDGETIYYCALQGLTLYSVPASALRDFALGDAEISARVVNHGAKAAPSDGLLIHGHTLYYGGLTTNTLYAWDTRLGTLTEDNQQVVATDAATLQWIDSFALRGDVLYLTTNRLQLYITRSVYKEQDANYRLFKLSL